jgi:hypothetical protein
MGNQTIKKITGALHEIVGDDMRTTMEEVKKVMDQAGRMGMLTGISDAQTFKQRFGGIIKQVRQIADIMGTTLEQAAPMMGQLGQMGMWKASDVMGTAVAGRISGAAAPQMMQTMQQGAQVSHAMGGTLRAGAVMGQNAFMDIQAARRAGTFSHQDVMEFTGGVGGAQGQQIMAQRMQRMMSTFSQTSPGRLMMAGLGEMKEGVFTGGVDREKLEKFQRGEISIQDLKRMGYSSTRKSRGAAMSFFRQAGKLGQNIGAEGGIQAMGKIVQEVADTKFGGSEQARHQLLQQMLGVSNREAEMIGRLMDDMPRIKDQQVRAAEDAINKTFDDLERRQNRSWGALKTAIKSSLHESLSRPFQEAGERLAADFGEGFERLGRTLTGKVERIAMGTKERGRLLRSGALTQDFSDIVTPEMGRGFTEGGMLENLTRGVRQEGVGGVLTSTMKGAAVGALAGGVGALPGAMVGAGMGVYDLMTGEGGMTRRQEAFSRIGVGPGAGRAEQELGMRHAMIRAQAPTRKALGFDKDDRRVGEVRTKLRTAIGQSSDRLRQMKKKNPRGYAAEVLRSMGMKVTRENLNMLAVAQEEEDFGGGDLAVDFKSMAADAGGRLPGTPAELAEMQTDLLDQLTEASGARNLGMAALQGAGVGAAGGAVGGLLGMGLGAVLGAGAGLVTAAVKDTGFEREDIQAALTGEGSEILQKYLAKGDVAAAREDVQRLGAERAGKVGELIEAMERGDIDKGKFKELAQKFQSTRGAQVQMEALGKIRDIAAKGPSEVRLRGPGAAEKMRGFSELVETYRGGKDRTLSRDEVMSAQEKVGDLAKGLTDDQARQFMRAGSIGRQVAALHIAGQAATSEGMTGKQMERTLAKLRTAGYDIEGMGGGDMVKRILKDKKVSKEEAKEFGDEAAKIIKSSMSETAESKKTHNEKMMEQLRIYTDANTKFVNAVKVALDDDLEDKEAAEALNQAGRSVAVGSTGENP